MTGNIGTNLGPVGYGSSDHPFINMMKTCGRWGGQGSLNNGYVSALNADGYPTARNSDTTNQPTNLFAANVNQTGQANRIHVLHDGSNVVSLSSANSMIVTPVSGYGTQHVVYDLTPPTADVYVAQINNYPPDPGGNWPTNIAIVRDDQLSRHMSGEIFNPKYVEEQSTWSVLRMMDWGLTNSNPVTDSTQRAKLSDCSWALKGVPLPAMVRLCNDCDADIHYNIPHDYTLMSTTSDLSYIRDNLEPGLKTHLEYSNEPWNFNFQQFGYLNDLGHNDPAIVSAVRAYLGDPNFVPNHLHAYGYKIQDHVQAAQAVFSATPDRLIVHANLQTGYPLYEYFLPGIQCRGHIASDFVDNTAHTGYLQGGMNSDNATNIATLNAMADIFNNGNPAQKQAQVDRIIAQLRYGNDPGFPDGYFNLVQWSSIFTAAVLEAASHGLGTSIYEIQACHWNFANSAFFAKIKPMLQAALDDIGMGEVLKTQLAFVRTKTDQAVNIYTNYGLFTNEGPFGTKSGPYAPDNARALAYRYVQGEKGVIVPPLPPLVGFGNPRRLLRLAA